MDLALHVNGIGQLILPRFEAVVNEIPEIVFCEAVVGGVDYVHRFMTKDVAHYQHIMDDLLEREVGIETYFSYIVTKSIKDSSSIPLASLLQKRTELESR